MKTNFKIFENTDENYEVLGENESYWQWEYDTDIVKAQILLDKSDNKLYLKIRKVHIKSGLGAGAFPTDLEFVKIGNLQDPDLTKVRPLLKKYGHDRTSAGGPFSKHWQDDEGNKMLLTDLIKMYKEEHPELSKKPELKHIKSIKSFDTTSKGTGDIELVKYSEYSYALFGEGTKKIKDELGELGCKYNRFLTDSKTKEKRPGWIFAIGKLDKVKKLL